MKRTNNLMCDYKDCKSQHAKGFTLFRNNPYKNFGQLHLCPDHMRLIIRTIEKTLKMELKANERTNWKGLGY